MSLPPQHQSHLRDSSMQVQCPPKRGDSEKLEKEGLQVGDHMDALETDDNNDDAAKGNAEWLIFTKRKPNRKVKPEQLHLERTLGERGSVDYIVWLGRALAEAGSLPLWWARF
ncbi:hypothetical protein HPB50_002688 [Hyalomma asiaticum]|uniref:Uncharacterized protein n=1 Tax=Hyalomma asiaticum TaxID=266040 RepID=A0ACB7TBB8_HYAAI|nr:hypothetical protein HPB50_002688 [Hyalomma asiaticum]